jgi:hypothetical protein
LQAMACNIIVERINDCYSIARGVSPEVVDLTNEIQVQSKAKRRAEAVAAAAVLQAGDSNKKAKASTSATAAGLASATILIESYWDSPEEKELFLGNSSDYRRVVDVLQERIERLQQVNKSPDGWRDVIDVPKLFMKAVGWVLRLRLPTNARSLVGILCCERIVSTFHCLIQRSTNNKDHSGTFVRTFMKK